jgi:hypothetical protein
MDNHVDLIEKELEAVEVNNPDFFKSHPDLKLKDCVFVSFRKYTDTNELSGNTLYFTCDLTEKIEGEVKTVVSNFQLKEKV